MNVVQEAVPGVVRGWSGSRPLAASTGHLTAGEKPLSPADGPVVGVARRPALAPGLSRSGAAVARPAGG